MRMSTKPKTLTRCKWADSDALMAQYHDTEWGVPLRDSRTLWEMLMLEGFQAGLSWSVVLKKREALRKAFKNFEPARVARLGEADIERMLQNADIIRSRAKIEATIGGAKAFLAMERGGEDFAEFVWGLAGGKPIMNTGEVPTQTPLSVQFSKEFKKRGFKFVGPVIVYAWMQAVGIVDDHSPGCFKRQKR